MIDASRGVTCGIVSIPTARSIATAATSAERRARAIGLSLMSTTSTTPDVLERRARPGASTPCSSPWAGRARPRRPTRPRSSLRSGASAPHGARTTRPDHVALEASKSQPAARAPSSTAARIAAICAGVVPQQPPTIRAPSRARLRGELGEVVRRRVRIDDAAARAARQADVRLRGEREPVLADEARPSRRARRAPPGAQGRSSRRSRRRRPSCRRSTASRAATPASVCASSSNVSWATIGSERRSLHRRDRGLELLEVEERLDHEEVDAAALEQASLLEEDVVGVLGRRSSPRGRRAGRSSRRRTPGVPATSRASRASLTPASTISAEPVVEELRRQLAPVRAERVRLDQLRAGANEREVDADDGLGCLQVRLLRAPKAGHPVERSAPVPPSATTTGPFAGARVRDSSRLALTCLRLRLSPEPCWRREARRGRRARATRPDPAVPPPAGGAGRPRAGRRRRGDSGRPARAGLPKA